MGSTVDSYVSEDASDSNNPEELFIDTIKWGDGPNAVGIRTIWVFDGVELKALYFDEKELFDVWNHINKIHISCDSIKINPKVELTGRL